MKSRTNISQKKWTEQEIDWLRENINRYTNKQLCDILHRSKSSIQGSQKRFNIYRSPEERLRRLQATQFKKGHVPANKGIKGTHFSPKSEFKKGHTPANIKHDGAISVRVHKRTGIPYKWIRIAKAKWIMYNRYVWEQYSGEPVPDNHIVGFVNGDTLNCRIENLYCMSKADNARRNRNPKKAAESMRKVWQEGRHYQSDKYIVSCISQRDKELRKEIEKHPELIEMKRQELLLRRAIKNAKEQTDTPADR